MPNKIFKQLGEKAIFLKKNWQIAYAAILIVLVPVAIVANTLFVVNNFRDTVDVQLQRTALMVGRAFNATSMDRLSDPALLQERVNTLAEAIPEIKTLDVLAREGDEFKVIASLDQNSLEQISHGRQNVLSWYDNQAIAFMTKSGRSAAMDQTLTPEEARSGDRYWAVVIPLHDETGEKTLLLSTKLSLSVIDGLVSKNLFWSYIWLTVTVLIIILILLSNTRMFEYASLYRRLREVDSMKDDFISMASHELRAPITAVRGYLSLFLENAFMPVEGKAREAMETTFHIATHLGTLVEDLLDVSRIEQGRMKMDLEDLEVEPLVKEIMQQMKFEAEKKSLSFEFQKPDAPLPLIRADRARLKQIVINLVSNAIKYTPSGSVNITSTVKDDGMVEIRVIDTGLGMSAEQREKLFQKFYRVKTDETSQIPGTGLGLWITKKIVEIMKGKIYCDSIEKVGTQMSVLLPIAKTGASPSDSGTQDGGSAGKANEEGKDTNQDGDEKSAG